MLRMMTDPEALRDPERLKAFRAQQERETRRRVLGSLRINSLVLTILGSIGFTLGCLMVALKLLAPELVEGVPVFGGLLPMGIGALFFFLGRRMAPVTSRSVLMDGVSGTAVVREVKSLTRNVGIKLSGISATAGLMTCGLTVSVQGREVDVEHREWILGSDIRYFTIGKTLPIRCAAGNPNKLAIDWDEVTP
jgi:hypothetical protein